MKEKGPFYCSDKGFCGAVEGTINAQIINTRVSGKALLETSVDPSSVSQQEAFQKLLTEGRMEVDSHTGHAVWTPRGYSWFLSQVNSAKPEPV